MRKKNLMKRALAGILAVTLFVQPMTAYATVSNDKEVTALYNAQEMDKIYLEPSEDMKKEFPTGAVVFPLSNATISMNTFYPIDIYRQGGTEGEASIDVHSVDMTALYGVDYEIYLSDKNTLGGSAVKGEANPYYDFPDYSFIPRVSQTEVVYGTNEGTNVSLKEEREATSDAIDENAQLLPKSSEFTVDFADGEAKKTIYIQTLMRPEEDVSDNLEFTLNLTNPENTMIGVQTSVAFTIEEEREKPDTYLEVQDAKVNPRSEEAYVVVKRTGNLGSYISYEFTTNSDTAEGGKAYESICREYQFTPGMQEQKIPITMLAEAEDGTSFDATITSQDAGDVEVIVKEDKATVEITEEVPRENAHETAASQGEMTNAVPDVSSMNQVNLKPLQDSLQIDNGLGMGTSVSNVAVAKTVVGASATSQSETETDSLVIESETYRNINYVSLADFNFAVATHNGSQTNYQFSYIPIGKSENGADHYERQLQFFNDPSRQSNAMVMESAEKIDFTGIEKIKFRFDAGSGSVAGDRVAVYISDDPMVESNTGDFNFVDQLDDNKIGAVRSLGEVLNDSLFAEAELDKSKVNGEHYLYLMVYKTGFKGCATTSIYDGIAAGKDDKDYNVCLYKKKYSMEVIDPDPMTIYVNGSKTTKKPKENIMLVKPNATSDESATEKSIDIYRDEMTVLSIPDAGLDNVKLVGYQFCKPSNPTEVSEVVPFNTDKNGSPYITLTSKLLFKYDDYIEDEKIMIKPLYEASESHLKVQNTTQKLSDKSILSFVVDDTGFSGTCYHDKIEIGKISWTETCRDNSAYMIGDQIAFKWTDSSDSTDEKWTDWTFALNYRMADVESDLAYDKEYKEYDTLDMKKAYMSVSPEIILEDTSACLSVLNPTCGTFIGQDDGQTENVKTETGIDIMKVHGYKVGTGDDEKIVRFDELEIGDIASFAAKPNDGYRAKWTYRDCGTGVTKTYYGNSFFFKIQNPYEVTDNEVMLEFEKLEVGEDGKVDSRKSVFVKGTTSVQVGSILNPPSSDTQAYEMAEYTGVSIGDYHTISDSNGTFVLRENNTDEFIDNTTQQAEPATIETSEDETIRVLTLYNNQYHIVDVDMGECLKNSEEQDTVNIDIKVNYPTSGPRPASIGVYNSYNELCPSPLELIRGSGYRFEVLLDLTKQNPDKPVTHVRWSIESEDGYRQEPVTFELTPDEQNNDTIVSAYGEQFGDIMNVDDQIYVELLHIGVNESGSTVESSYGKYNTGYTFYRSNTKESVTYAPDLGAPPSLANPVPGFGPISPTVSIAGFLPIIDYTHDEDESGNSINTITIGINYKAASSGFGEEFKTAKPRDKGKQISEKLTAMASNSDKELIEALNLKTSFKVSFNTAVCYQGVYVVDKTGNWCFTSNIMILGIGGDLKASQPFCIYGVPCFVNVTAGLQLNAYLNLVPRDPSQMLTTKTVGNPEYTAMKGTYLLKGSLGFGLGVGFDALVAVSGGVSGTLDINIEDYINMWVKISLKGDVGLDLLFLKVAKKFDIASFSIYDSTPDSEVIVAKAMASATEEEILKTVRLSDMSIESSVTATDTSPIEKMNTSSHSDELELTDLNNFSKPSIMHLLGEKYLVTALTPYTCKANGNVIDSIHYWIYDNSTGTCQYEGNVLDKVIADLKEINASDTIVAKYGMTKEEIQGVIDEATKDKVHFDTDVQLTDCGDDILFTWTKAGTTSTENHTLMKSVGIANIYYNKETNKFYNYSFIADDTKEYIYLNPQVVYNEETQLVQLFYEKMNVKDLTLDSTLYDIQHMDTTLETRYIEMTELSTDQFILGKNKWSNELSIAMSDNAFNYYDVACVGAENILSFVGSGEKGFTLESVDGFEQEDESFDTSAFNTVNSLYLQKFAMVDGKLTAGQQVELTGEDYVVANPEFAHINTTVGGKSIDNLLLFYKCNGLYGYQNINTLYNDAIYNDNGTYKVVEGYKQPIYITNEEDYAINDDFTIVSDNKNIYALWTTSEGAQQQLWSRAFTITGIDEVTTKPVLDKNGELIQEGPNVDPNVGCQIEQREEPIYILEGTWGGKMYLSESSLSSGEDSSDFKKEFAACVGEDDNLIAVYNAYNKNYDNEEVETEHLHLALGSYDTSPQYKVGYEGALDVSDVTPVGGNTINVSGWFENTGIQTGYDVNVCLYANGKKVGTVNYPIWTAGAKKETTIAYAVPKGVNISDISLEMRVEDTGIATCKSEASNLRVGDDLTITNLQLFPSNEVGSEDNNPAYDVVAQVVNNGNQDYTGDKYLQLIHEDQGVIAESMEADYEDKGEPAIRKFNYTEIPALEVGEKTTVRFNSKEIDLALFTKGGIDAAEIQGIITDNKQLEKATYKADEEITIFDQYHPGATMLERQAVVTGVKLSTLTVAVDTTDVIGTEVLPNKALLGKSVTYTSSDESIATVNEAGVVTGMKVGTCTITATIDGVSDTTTVTVVKEIKDENADGSGADDSDKDGTGADTGDAMNYMLWMILLALAFFGVAGVVIVKRRNKKVS